MSILSLESKNFHQMDNLLIISQTLRTSLAKSFLCGHPWRNEMPEKLKRLVALQSTQQSVTH